MSDEEVSGIELISTFTATAGIFAGAIGIIDIVIYLYQQYGRPSATFFLLVLSVVLLTVARELWKRGGE